MGIGLTLDQEIDLICRAQRGDQKALQKVVKSNMPYVIMKARRFSRRFGTHHEEDFIQEASRGLVRAVMKYDPSRRLALLTYANYWIESFMRNYAIDNFSIVRYGKSQDERRLFFILNRARYDLTRNGQPPSDEELAEYLNLPIEKFQQIQARLRVRDASVEAATQKTDDQGKATRQDKKIANLEALGASPEEEVTGSHDAAVLRQTVSVALNQLDPRARRIIEAYYMREDEATLAELGDEWNVTRERIRQIKSVAVTRLKKLLRKQLQSAQI